MAGHLPPGRRFALVLATGEYADPGLSRLPTPAHDAVALASLLGDPGVGGFEVTPVLDRAEQDVRRAVVDFLDGRRADDFLLVYLSGHGLLTDRRELYFAACDTRSTRLATAVESRWLFAQLDDCPARAQVVILDCCFSGAFARSAKAGSSVSDLLAEQARGRIVLTASRSTEYSFPAAPADRGHPAGSAFTAGLVEGIRSGAADTDGDGLISVDEAFDHAARWVRDSGVAQTPQRWIFGGEGRLVLARRPGPPALARPEPAPTGVPAAPERRSPAPTVPEQSPVAVVDPVKAWLLLGVVVAIVIAFVVINFVVVAVRSG